MYHKPAVFYVLIKFSIFLLGKTLEFFYLSVTSDPI